MPDKHNKTTDWREWCRLCANEDLQGNVKIQQPDKDSKEGPFFNLAAVIEKHFSVKINNDEELPKTLCASCFSRMTYLINFTKRVSKVQQLFDLLLNSPTVCSNEDLHAMRLNFQLSDEQSQPEMHYIDIKSEKYVQNDFHIKDPLEQLEIEIKIENESCSEQHPCEMEENSLKLEDKNQLDSDIIIVKKVIQTKRKGTADEKEKATTETIYPCTKCPQQFKRFLHFQRHIKRPHFPCAQCPKVFMTQDYLDQHSQIHLPAEMKKLFSCPHCEKKYTSNVNLKLHIKQIHLNECPYICEKCGEPAASTQMLEYHMLKHTDETPFECEFCKKRFKHRRFLKKHMRYHDDKDQICNECGLQLKSAITLKRHMLVHSNELHYKCNQCGRGFKRAKTLKTHLLLHTGLKPYSCDFCNLTFANGSNCRTHKKRSHPEELAAQEAAGTKTFPKNIPKLRTLIEATKTSNDLLPVTSKPSGNFAYKRNIKLKSAENQANTPEEAADYFLNYK